jgi:hypothetical protein
VPFWRERDLRGTNLELGVGEKVEGSWSLSEEWRNGEKAQSNLVVAAHHFLRKLLPISNHLFSPIQN